MTVVSAADDTARAAQSTRSGQGRHVGEVLIVALLLVALAGYVLRRTPVDNNWVVVATVLAPYLMLTAPVAVVVALLDRAWLAAVLAMGMTVLAGLTQAPLYRAASPPADAVALRMMTANLRLGLADPGAVVRLVRTHDVAVLTTQELTAAAVERLLAAGLGAYLPFHATDARPNASGVGIWSRYPLHAVRRDDAYRFAFVSARVDVASVSVAPTVVAAHMPGPWPQSSTTWSDDIARLPGTLRALARGESSRVDGADAGVPAAGAVLVGCDFNATPDLDQFRRVVRDGFHDGADQAGSGLQPTYPGDSWAPPLIAIDHVLTYAAVATRTTTVRLPGSDHRGLIAVVAVPREPESHRS